MEEEFDEEEVWNLMWESDDVTPKARQPKDAPYFSSAKAFSASRKIPRSKMLGEENGAAAAFPQSAPVAVPRWSNVSKKGENHGEDEEEEEDRVPPHVWIAKKMERTAISSSVCEGAGRTLKGRDQHQVRDAVFTRTGFLG